MSYHNVGLSPFATDSFELGKVKPHDGLYPEMPDATPTHLTPDLDAAMAGTLGQTTVNQALQNTNSQIPSVYGNSSTGQFFVNGLLFDAGDHKSALESESYLAAPATQEPQGTGWQPIDTAGFQGYINSIKDPSLGTLTSKNFGIGMDNLQLLSGYGLELAGAESLGQSIQDQQLKDLSYNEPYQREFSGIEDSEGALDWFVANFAQQGPNLIESLVVAAGGYALGGPAPSIGAGFANFIGKKTWKDSVKAAAEKRALGKTLDAAEKKVLKQATAAAAVVTNNYLIGASDIYGEVKDADPEWARWKALAGALPYAALETMPEYFLASRLMGGVKGKGGILRRFGTGVAVGAPLEGMTESGQEAILMGLNPDIDINSEEGMLRILNSFAAGAGVGGPIGGVANLKGYKRDLSGAGEVNLLDAAEPAPLGLPAPALQLENKVDTEYGDVLSERETLEGIIANVQRQLAGIEIDGLIETDGRPATKYKRTAHVEELETAMANAEARLAELDAQLGAPIGIDLERLGREYPQITQDEQAQIEFGKTGTAEEQAKAVEKENKILKQKADAEMQSAYRAEQANLTRMQAQELAARQQEEAEAKAKVKYEEELNKTARGQAILQAKADAKREADDAAQKKNLERSQDELNKERLKDEYEKEKAKLQAAEDELSIGESLWIKLRPARAKHVSYNQLPEAQRAQWEFLIEAAERAGDLPENGVDKLIAKHLLKEVIKAHPGFLKQTNIQTQELESEQEEIAETADELEARLAAAQLADATQGEMFPEQPTVKYTPEDEKPKSPAELEGESKARLKALKKQLKSDKGNEELKAAIATEERVIQALRSPMLTDKGKVRQAVVKANSQETANKLKAKRDVAAKKAASKKVEEEASKVVVIPKAKPVVKKEEPVVKKEEPVVKKEVNKSAEEAWESLRPEIAEVLNVGLEQLAVTRQAQWRSAVEQGTESVALAADLIRQESEIVEAILDADEVKEYNLSDFESLIYNIIEATYFDSGVKDNKAIKGKDYIEFALKDTKNFTSAQHHIINQVITQAVINNGGVKKSHAIHGLLQRQELLDVIEDRLSKGETPKPKAASEAKKDTSLRGLLDSVMDGLVQVVKDSNEIVTEIEKAYKANKKSFKYKGKSISKYFTDGKLNLHERSGQFNKGFLFPTARTAKEQTLAKPKESFLAGLKKRLAKVEKGLKATPKNKLLINQRKTLVSEIAEEEADALLRTQSSENEQAVEGISKMSNAERESAEWDNDGGKHYRVENNEEIKNPLGRGKIRLIIQQFKRKLRVKPVIHVTNNLETLKKENPALYKRAAAARKTGDFDTVRAIGYSFGNEIIIFSDNVRTEHTLKFVLAHETFGHYGLRSLLGPAEMKKVLMDIYKSDPHISLVADRMVHIHKMNLLEAIEEAVADKAGAAHASTIMKIWNAIKNALNKLGLKFEDDLARYWVGQSRRYIRHGDAGVVSTAQLVANAKQIARDGDAGRFSVETDTATLSQSVLQTNAMNKVESMFSTMEGFSNLLKNKTFMAELKGKKGGINSVVSKVLETVQTLNNKATKSEGLNEIWELFQKQAHRVNKLLGKYNDMTATVRTTRNWWGGDVVSKESIAHINELLAYAAIYKGRATTEKMLRTHKSLFDLDANGMPIRNEAAIKSAFDEGYVSPEAFMAGLEVTYDTEETVTYKPQWLIDMYNNRNSSEEALKGWETMWVVYNEHREAVMENALDVLEAKLKVKTARHEKAFDDIANEKGADGKSFSKDQMAIIREILDTYIEINHEGAVITDEEVKLSEASRRKADSFIKEITRALYKDKKVVDFLEGNEEEASEVFRTDPKYKHIIDNLRSLHEIGLTQTQAERKVQHVIQELYMLDTKTDNAEFTAKRTIMGSYVPLNRDGKYQVVIRARDENGKYVKLTEELKSVLPYYQTDSFEDADELVRTFNTSDMALNNGKPRYFDVDMHDIDAGGTARVTLEAFRSESDQTPPLSSNINYDEFVDALAKTGVHLNLSDRAKVTKSLANFHTRARKTLKRSGTPGWDGDILKHTASYLETGAHVAAKTSYSYRVDDIMDNNTMWAGNKEQLLYLAAEVDRQAAKAAKAKSPAERMTAISAKSIAKQKFDRYAYMYAHSAEVGKDPVLKVKVDGEIVELELLGRGKRYMTDARKLIEWYKQSNDIVSDVEGYLSKGLGSKLKMATVMLQLGGNFATALINLTSIPMHSLPLLASYNAKRGVGGGFSTTKAAAALVRAGKNMKNAKMETVAYMQEIANSKKLQKNHGLTQDEADFLLEQTREGLLAAAQFNALIGTSRGGIQRASTINAVQKWMQMFTYTEQFNRRTTALASYRLERDKAMASGMMRDGKPTAAGIKHATKEARRHVVESQGVYDMHNRPELGRGDILQYPYMYKQFVVHSVQLLKAMSPKGRMMYIGMILFASGLKGIPFADDLVDIADTLMEMFGIKSSGIEKEMNLLLAEIAPGVAPVVMRGFLDGATGSTMSTRVGHGDLIPMTGMFKATSDPWREFTNFLGPVYSAGEGIVATGSDLAKYVAEVIGIREDVTSFSDIMRNSPASGIRAAFDSYTYYDDGMITNGQGKVISHDVAWYSPIARLLGFYPSVATRQNDIVRMSKQSADYAKQFSMEFRQAYVKAKLSGDRDAMRDIQEAVRDWNDGTRGTEFYIRNFTKGANRAYKEWNKPTIERYLKASPKSGRDGTRLMMEAYDLD